MGQLWGRVIGGAARVIWLCFWVVTLSKPSGFAPFVVF